MCSCGEGRGGWGGCGGWGGGGGGSKACAAVVREKNTSSLTKWSMTNQVVHD